MQLDTRDCRADMLHHILVLCGFISVGFYAFFHLFLVIHLYLTSKGWIPDLRLPVLDGSGHVSKKKNIWKLGAGSVLDVKKQNVGSGTGRAWLLHF